MDNQTILPEQRPVEEIPIQTLQQPSSKSKLPIILFVIILLFFFSFGGIFIGKYFLNNKTKIIPSIIPTIISSPTLSLTPSIAPTIIQKITLNIPSNWKTYNNDKFKFSIKIPLDAETKSREPDPFPVAIQIDNINEKTLMRGEGFNGWLMIISEPLPNPKQLSLQEWSKSTLVESTFNSPTFLIKQLDINGYSALKSRPNPTFYQTYYLIKKSSTEMVYILVNNGGNSQFDSTTDQIISTLNFTQ